MYVNTKYTFATKYSYISILCLNENQFIKLKNIFKCKYLCET